VIEKAKRLISERGGGSTPRHIRHAGTAGVRELVGLTRPVCGDPPDARRRGARVIHPRGVRGPPPPSPPPPDRPRRPLREGPRDHPVGTP